MTKPKLQDVARVAGVGTSTVSRVLNDHPNISGRSRQRVLEAIEALGYTPDLNARTFRSGQTHAVSVLLPNTGTRFFETLIGAAYAVLAAAGYDVALFPLLGSAPTRRHRDPLALMYRADALLIASQHPDDLYEGRPPFQKPIVLVDMHHPGYHSVYFDNLAAGRLAAEQALTYDCPLVFLDAADQPGLPGSPVFAERRNGMLRCLTERGIRPWQTLTVSSSHQGFRDAAQVLVQAPRPFVVLAMSDGLALGLHRVLHDGGLRRGADYRMVGVDGSAEALSAGIDSVAQPIEAMGQRAGEVLLSAIRGELPGLVRQRFQPSLLRGVGPP